VWKSQRLERFAAGLETGAIVPNGVPGMHWLDE
jgi:hypothetical protein